MDLTTYIDNCGNVYVPMRLNNVMGLKGGDTFCGVIARNMVNRAPKEIGTFIVGANKKNGNIIDTNGKEWGLGDIYEFGD